MTEQMVHVSDEKHPCEDNNSVEFQSLFAVDVKFLQVKIFFKSGEESFHAGAFFVFLVKPFWVVWSDSGFGCFDDGCYMVFQQGLSYGSRVKGEITNEESCGEPSVVCFYLGIKSVKLLGVMDVCSSDSECSWEFGFRVDHHMNFIPVHVLFFDVVPSPFSFRVIRVCWEDGTIFDDRGDAEELFRDELLNDLVEEVLKGVKSNAFDEVTVISNVRVVFESECSSPELVFFEEIMVISVGFHTEKHQQKGEEHSCW